MCQLWPFFELLWLREPWCDGGGGGTAPTIDGGTICVMNDAPAIRDSLPRCQQSRNTKKNSILATIDENENKGNSMRDMTRKI
jgi:hypothetical protein